MREINGINEYTPAYNTVTTLCAHDRKNYAVRGKAVGILMDQNTLARHKL